MLILKDIKEILNYNFDKKDLVQASDYNDLFCRIRRDSNFAYVYRSGNAIYALRDHLGNIPLYYKIYDKNKIKFSFDLFALVSKDSLVQISGLKTYLALGTTKICSLFNDVNVVSPGSVLEFNITNEGISQKKIYQYKLNTNKVHLNNMKEYLCELDKLFMRSLERVVIFI